MDVIGGSLMSEGDAHPSACGGFDLHLRAIDGVSIDGPLHRWCEFKTEAIGDQQFTKVSQLLACRHEPTAGQLCFELIGDLEQLLDELTQFAVVHRLALGGCLKINAAIGTTRLNVTL